MNTISEYKVTLRMKTQMMIIAFAVVESFMTVVTTVMYTQVKHLPEPIPYLPWIFLSVISSAALIFYIKMRNKWHQERVIHFSSEAIVLENSKGQVSQISWRDVSEFKFVTEIVKIKNRPDRYTKTIKVKTKDGKEYSWDERTYTNVTQENFSIAEADWFKRKAS